MNSRAAWVICQGPEDLRIMTHVSTPAYKNRIPNPNTGVFLLSANFCFLEMVSTMGEDDVKICVVNEVFCASHPVEMVAKHTATLFSKPHFQVVDSKDKALIFHVEGTRLGLKPIMLDAAGSPILTMKAKAFSLHERWKIYRGDSTEKKHLLFHLKVSKLSTNLDVFLPSNTSEKCDFHVKSEHSKKWCTIYKGDSIVAEVSDKSTFAESIWGKDVMVIRVYPHVDHAFITALFVILYEIKLAQTIAAASAEASAGVSAGAVAVALS